MRETDPETDELDVGTLIMVAVLVVIVYLGVAR